jgi:pimeloyl-ACP methyl ester carboxylesterase
MTGQVSKPHVWIAMFALSCGKSATHENPAPKPGSDVSAAKPAAPRERLELWLGGIEQGQAVARDDGAQLTSEVTLAGKVETIRVTRSTRKAEFTSGTKSKELDIPADSLPWGTGHVAIAKLAIEWFPGAKAKAIKLVHPRGTVDATLTVTPTSVEITIASGPLSITVDARGVNHATTGGAKPALEMRATPDGIVDEVVALEHDGIITRGVLWMPESAPAKVPVLVLHAGTGPTDRDCNQAGAMWTDSFRMVAEALARKQIATVRFDKRFSGQTTPVGRAWTKEDIVALRIDNYADDLVALVHHLRKDARLGPITIMGHSEGGLVSVLAAGKLGADAPDALLFVNSLGRKFSVTLREQLAPKIDPKMLREYDDMLDQLRTNKPVTIPEWIQPSGLVTPDTLGYFKSAFDLDPGELLGKLKIPAAVIQGETDVQTTLDDANGLVARRSDVKVTRLPHTNHVLKAVPEKTQDMASYQDPTLPLAPGVVDAIAGAIKR